MDIPNYEIVKQNWKKFEEYLIETRYAVKDVNGQPLEHTLDDVLIRVCNWLSTEKVKNNLPTELHKIYDYNLDIIIDALKNKIIIPATPVLMNAGAKTRRTGYFSCFPLGYVEDSIEDIFNKGILMKDIYLRAGGSGINVSKLRPKGELVDGSQGYASGPVSFLAIYDAIAGSVSQGGRRRGALMVDCSENNKDWKSFVKCKSDNPGTLNNMNISLDIEDDLKDEVVDEIAKCIWECGDPGLIFIKNAYENTPIPIEMEPRFCNPCITGDTLLYVAGRGPVTIKELADEGEDVPLYCCDTKENKIKVSIGTHPRKTCENAQLYKVTLDDGSYFRATADHKIPMLDGTEKSVIDLITGESLIPFWMITGIGGEKYINGKYPEYRLIAEAKFGDTINMEVHHKDLNHFNNEWDNINILSNHDHRSLHSSLLIGDKNPMYGHVYTQGTRDKLKEAWEYRRETPEYFKMIKAASDRMKILSKDPDIIIKRSITQTKPIVTITRNCSVCKSPFNIKVTIGNEECGRKTCSDRCAGLLKGSQTSKAFKDNPLLGKHRSELVKSRPNLSDSNTKAAYASARKKAMRCCNLLIGLKKEIKRELWNSYYNLMKPNGIKTFIREETINKLWNNNWQQFYEDSFSYNHKVVSVELDGVEDVYNITVDKYHNYVVVTNLKSPRPGHKIKEGITGVVIKNCSEYISLAKTCCNLLSINVTKLAETNTADTILDAIAEASYLASILGTIIIYQKDGYPSDEIMNNSIEYRPVGLGMLGLHGAMIRLGIKYNSLSGYELAESVQSAIALGSMTASAYMIEEHNIAVPCRKDWLINFVNNCKKKFYQYDIDTILNAIEKYGSLYNLVTTVQAPTGSISQLVHSASNGIEPLYSINTTRKVKDLDKGFIDFELYPLEIFNDEGDIVVDLNELEGSLAHTMTAEDQMKLMAGVQKLCHTAISKTINVPEETTIDQIKEIIRSAFYKYKLKCITIYRDSSKAIQILNRNIKEEDLDDNFPAMRKGVTYTINGPRDCHVTFNEVDDSVREIFISSGKSGTSLNALLEALGRVLSIALRWNPELLRKISTTLQGIDSGTFHEVNNKNYKSIPDAISGIINDLYINKMPFIPTKPNLRKIDRLNMCPSCGHMTLKRNGSCLSCTLCDYSSC